jgi:hypothetical protein
MNWVNEWADRALAYVLAFFGLFSAEQWMAVGGGILLACKLIQEIPRTVAYIRSWFS